MKLLEQWDESCRRWYNGFRDGPNRWRRRVYQELIGRHGAEAVARHAKQIKAVLDRVEEGRKTCLHSQKR